MEDSYGDGWNGNWLYFDDDLSTTWKVTLTSGHSGIAALFLPPGVYSPFACGGTWDHEVTWTIDEAGLSGGADDSCTPIYGSFTVSGDGVTLVPTASPTPVPTRMPTAAPTQCNVIVHMTDTYGMTIFTPQLFNVFIILSSLGDGWNGNYLYFSDDMDDTTWKLTFSHGHSSTKSICLPPGTYEPFACGGGWPHECGWSIEGYGISGGADSSCTPSSGSFTVLADGESVSPTVIPTSSPTAYPTSPPSQGPTVVATSGPTITTTSYPTIYSTSTPGECCCNDKLDEVLANQDTIINSLDYAGTKESKSASDSSPHPADGTIALSQVSVIVGTIVCSTLLAGALVAAIYYRQRVQALEEALGRHGPLASLELGAYN